MCQHDQSSGPLIESVAHHPGTITGCHHRSGPFKQSLFFMPACWIVSPACSSAAARTSRRNRWSGVMHWQWWPNLIIKERAMPGGCQPSTNWRRWWIAPPTARPCRPAILSPTCRTFTGRLPPACSSPIGPGPCIWKKARPTSDKNGLHNFRYGPWQLSIEFIS